MPTFQNETEELAYYDETDRLALTEWERLYHAGDYLTLARRYCHEKVKTQPQLQGDNGEYDVVLYICCHEERFPLADLVPDLAEAAMRLSGLLDYPVGRWSEAGRDALKRLADFIIERSRGGMLGC